MYYADVLMKVVEKYKKINKDKRVVANMLDAQVLESVVRRPQASPRNHANFLNMDYDKVMQIMRYFSLHYKRAREAVFKEIDDYLALVEVQLNHERSDTIDGEIKAFVKGLGDRLKESADAPAFKMKRGFHLLALLKFCSDKRHYDIFPERQIWVKELSAIDARNFFRDLSYEIDKKEKGFDVNSLTDIINESVHEDSTADEDEIASDDSEEDRVQALNFKLQTTQSTLQFIQRSLDDMIANIEQRTVEAKEEAVNDFFSQINSERYGRLLDNALLIDQKIARLRKEKYRFPIEIMAMPMIIKNFIAFIKGIGFQPIKTMGEVYKATAEDLVYAVYEGEPFLGDEQKTVQVVCPGWMRNGVILSKPVVREVIKD